MFAILDWGFDIVHVARLVTRLSLNIRHEPFGIPLAGRHKRLENPINLLQLGIRQIHHLCILPHALGLGRSRNRDNRGHAWSTRHGHDPTDGDLPRSAPLALRDAFHCADELEVLVKVVLVEAREYALAIVGGEVVERLELPAEKPSTKRCCQLLVRAWLRLSRHLQYAMTGMPRSPHASRMPLVRGSV